MVAVIIAPAALLLLLLVAVVATSETLTTVSAVVVLMSLTGGAGTHSVSSGLVAMYALALEVAWVATIATHAAQSALLARLGRGEDTLRRHIVSCRARASRSPERRAGPVPGLVTERLEIVAAGLGSSALRGGGVEALSSLRRITGAAASKGVVDATERASAAQALLSTRLTRGAHATVV